MFETALNNTNFYFDESYSLQLLTPPLNLYIWSKMPGPSLMISPSAYDELRKIKIFKTTFKKLSILSKFWKWRIWQWVSGGGGEASYLCHLICVIMTYCLWKSTCDSPLRWNPKIQLYRNIIFETDFCLNESLITSEYKKLFSVFFLFFLNKISLPGLFFMFCKKKCEIYQENTYF